MDLSHITSQSLRRILNLAERKDQLVKLVAELENEITKVFSGVVAPASKSPAKKSAPARKAGKRKSARKAKSGALKAKVLSLLENAGTGGLKVKEIAEKLGVPAANISVWFSTTGKKLTRKLAPGRYAVKGAKPASAPVKALPVKRVAAAKIGKKGKRPAPLKARILALLKVAGPKGMRVRDIAAKLDLPGGNVSVWISTTGKKLVSKVEPGVYAVKGTKSAGVTRGKTAPKRASKRSRKLQKNKGKN